MLVLVHGATEYNVLEKLEDELLLILVRMDQIVGLEIVIVLPDEHLPQAIPEVHPHILLLIILLDRAILAVADVDLLENIEERHVEHVRIHLCVLDAGAGAGLKAHQGLEAFDYLSIIQKILQEVVGLDRRE